MAGEFEDFMKLPQAEQDEIRHKAGVLAEAQAKIQRAFSQWYTDKTGIPTLGAVFKVGDDLFKVLHHDERVPGYFLVLRVKHIDEQPPQGILTGAVQVYFHPPPPGEGMADLLVEMPKHMRAFLADVPEAKEWAVQMMEVRR